MHDGALIGADLPDSRRSSTAKRGRRNWMCSRNLYDDLRCCSSLLDDSYPQANVVELQQQNAALLQQNQALVMHTTMLQSMIVQQSVAKSAPEPQLKPALEPINVVCIGPKLFFSWHRSAVQTPKDSSRHQECTRRSIHQV